MTAKKPSILERIDDDLFFDLGLNADKDIRKYIEFYRLVFDQSSLTATFKQYFYQAIKKDLKYQDYLEKLKEKNEK